jgi:glycosyltransferase involved in cell wall biosynthesis
VNLLKALKITRDSGFDLQLVLTGSDHGTQKTVKALILELELNNSVHVLGFVSDKLLASLYAACSLLCFPSYFGPDNLPPLEALAYHKPVIVADVPGARDQLGDSALYFNPNSPHEIATLMMAIVSDVDIRRKLDISGSKLISERTTKNYVDIIESNLLTLLPAFENFRSRSSRV